MGAQVTYVGGQIVIDTIVAAQLSCRPFRLSGESGALYSADALIVATGARARWPGIPGEAELTGYGVSGRATCDGFFRDKKVLSSEVAIPPSKRRCTSRIWLPASRWCIEEMRYARITFCSWKQRDGSLRLNRSFSNPSPRSVFDAVSLPNQRQGALRASARHLYISTEFSAGQGTRSAPIGRPARFP